MTRKPIVALVVAFAMLGLVGCGGKSVLRSAFGPGSVGGVALTMQTAAQTSPDRLVLARLGSTPSSYANALVWVFEWDHSSDCIPSMGPPGSQATPLTCTVYEVTDAMVGGGVELVEIG